MNLRDLEYIIAVDREKSFTRAAEKVFVSQAALSIQVRKLEENLGVQLFERDNNEFLTTKAGQQIIKIAKEILAKADEMKFAAKLLQDEFSGEFKIGAFPTLAPYYFPKISTNITKKFPKIKLFLVEEKTDKLIEMLKNGELDAVFLAEPVDEIDFEKKIIFDEKFLLAVSKDNILAQRKRIDFDELKGKEMMLLQEGHCLRKQALSVCEMAQISENSDYRASSLETLRQMVRINNGITLMPEIAVTRDRQISYLKIKNAPTRKISLFWRENYYRKNLIKKLAEIL